MIKALIVEDNSEHARELLNLLEHYQNIDVVSSAISVEEAVASIKRASPELVFLDLELGPRLGFEIFDELENYHFYTIFTTAYNEHAVTAFKRHNVLHYLEKPLKRLDLDIAIERVQNAVLMNDIERVQLGVQELLSDMRQTQLRKQHIKILKGRFWKYVALEDIVFVEADEKYVQYQLSNGELLIAKDALTNVQSKLPQSLFKLSERGMLINIDFAKAINGETVLLDLPSNCINLKKHQEKKSNFSVLSVSEKNDRQEVKMRVARRRINEFRASLDSHLLK